MNKKIVIGIITFLVIAGIATGMFLFLNKDNNNDIEMWDELKIGMNKDEVVEKIYYRFGGDNCNKGEMGDKQYYIFEVEDFMGYDGQNAKISYFFDKSNKLTDYSVSIQAYTSVDYQKNVGEITEKLKEHFNNKAKDAGTDDLSFSDDKVTNYTYVYIVEDEVYSISMTNGMYLVSCTSFSDLLGIQ